MCVTRSNSGLFSTPGFLVSPVGERGMGAKKKKEGRRNKKCKGWKEDGIKDKEVQKGRRNQGERRKEKKMSSAGFKPVRLVLLVFLSVEQEGVIGNIGFTFLPS